MRRLLPLVFVLAACGPTGGESNHVADSGASGKPLDAAPATPVAPLKGNPNRLYQLDTLKKVDVDLKGHKVHLWVMDDESKQQEGMMFLEDKDVKPDEGMLFAFDQVQSRLRPGGEESGFWMHNTLIPLDIVYLSPTGQVIRVAHGKVQDDTGLPAGGDYKNVIELKAGAAARFGLKPGDAVSVPSVK